MQITEGACTFIKEQSKELKNPVLVLFQREYRGWCGTSVVNTVTPAEKDQIRDEGQFSIQKVPECDVPIYVEKKLEGLWNKAKIDVAGWSTFQRLVILQD